MILVAGSPGFSMWLIIWAAASIPSCRAFTSTEVSCGKLSWANRELLKERMERSFGMESLKFPQAPATNMARMSSLTRIAVGRSGEERRLSRTALLCSGRQSFRCSIPAGWEADAPEEQRRSLFSGLRQRAGYYLLKYRRFSGGPFRSDRKRLPVRPEHYRYPHRWSDWHCGTLSRSGHREVLLRRGIRRSDRVFGSKGQ